MAYRSMMVGGRRLVFDDLPHPWPARLVRATADHIGAVLSSHKCGMERCPLAGDAVVLRLRGSPVIRDPRGTILVGTTWYRGTRPVEELDVRTARISGWTYKNDSTDSARDASRIHAARLGGRDVR